jgi:hypothetical protein
VEILYPKRRSDVKSILLPDGCLVIFDESTEFAHTVSPIGAMAWELSDGEHSTGDIVTEINELTESLLEPEVLTKQVHELLNELKENGLLL